MSLGVGFMVLKDHVSPRLFIFLLSVDLDVVLSATSLAPRLLCGTMLPIR